MKFIHIADCHVGAWRDPLMKRLTYLAFERVIDRTIEERPDFMLIAGDLFHTAIPGIDTLKAVVKQLARLKNSGIPVYAIAGSHDFSPSGKTILHVLEEAELLIDVAKGQTNEERIILKFTDDKKTGAKITGIIGRKNSLDKKYYSTLNNNMLENEKGFKIFMFHTSIEELKTNELKEMDASPVSMLPKGFNYYAGGHVHIIKDISLEGYPFVVYPGPVFPANFSELEALKAGGMCIYEDGKLKREHIKIKEVKSILIDAEGKPPSEVTEEALSMLDDVEDKIILLRIKGKLSTGNTNDISFRDIITKAHENKAYFFMKNTAKLTSQDVKESEINISNPVDVERAIIEEHKEDVELVKALFQILGSEQIEGEKKYDYEDRVVKDALKLLEDKKVI